MLVKDIMSKSTRAIMPETSIAEAMSLMRFYQVDGLPVILDKELVGFVQLKNILAMFFPDNHVSPENTALDAKCLQRKYAPIARAAVKKVMDDTKRSISPSMTINEAMSVLLQANACSLAVTEKNKLVGMISLNDVNKAVLGLTSTKVAA